MPKSSRTGVSVYTWGSEMLSPEEFGFNGIKNYFLKTEIAGAHSGHAALLLTIADTQENQRLVNLYLSNTQIPYSSRTYKSASVYDEDVIEIYFSWWPTKFAPSGFFTQDQDGVGARKGIHVSYDQERNAETYFNPEVKSSAHIKDKILSPLESVNDGLITLGPRSTIHPSLAGEQHEIISLKHKLEVLQQKKRSVQTLIEHLLEIEKKNQNKKTVSISKEIYLMLKNNLEPEDLVSLNFNKRIPKSELDRLLKISQKQSSHLINECENTSIEYIQCLVRSPFHEALLNDIKYRSALQLLDPENHTSNELSTLCATENYFSNASAMLASLFLNSITTGTPPDHIIELPIQPNVENGLNVEEMLKKMQFFAQKLGQFNQFNLNCSTAVCGVMHSGTKPELAWIFEQAALDNAIFTPQMVYNNARLYQTALYHPDKTPMPNNFFLTNMYKKIEFFLAHRAIHAYGMWEAAPYKLWRYIESGLTGVPAFGLYSMRTLPVTLYQFSTIKKRSVPEASVPAEEMPPTYNPATFSYRFTNQMIRDDLESQTAKRQRNKTNSSNPDMEIENPLQLNELEFAELSRMPDRYPGFSAKHQEPEQTLEDRKQENLDPVKISEMPTQKQKSFTPSFSLLKKETETKNDRPDIDDHGAKKQKIKKN